MKNQRKQSTGGGKSQERLLVEYLLLLNFWILEALTFLVSNQALWDRCGGLRFTVWVSSHSFSPNPQATLRTTKILFSSNILFPSQHLKSLVTLLRNKFRVLRRLHRFHCSVAASSCGLSSDYNLKQKRKAHGSLSPTTQILIDQKKN